MKHYQVILFFTGFALLASCDIKAATVEIGLDSTATGCDIAIGDTGVSTTGATCQQLYPLLDDAAAQVFPDDVVVVTIDGTEYQRL